MVELIAGFIACENEEEAGKIAKALVEKRLSACCNIIPAKSFYWWKGKLQDTSEALVLFKTRKQLSEKLVKEAVKLHSYEIPSIEFFDISGGHKEFLDWIEREVRNEKGG